MDELKMATIINIQAMEEKVNILNPTTFAELEKMSYFELEQLRDSRLEMYNAYINKGE